MITYAWDNRFAAVVYTPPYRPSAMIEERQRATPRLGGGGAPQERGFRVSPERLFKISIPHGGLVIEILVRANEDAESGRAANGGDTQRLHPPAGLNPGRKGATGASPWGFHEELTSVNNTVIIVLWRQRKNVGRNERGIEDNRYKARRA